MTSLNKKPLNDDEKFLFELKQEKELQHQLRDYTILSKNREIIERSGGAKLFKQRKVIGIYRKELLNLTKDLNVATAPGKKRIDLKNSKTLTNMINQYDQLTKAVNLKKTYITEIDGQIIKVEKEIAHLKSLQLTDRMYEDRKLEGQKTLEALENKLDVQITKFCTICWENQLLKDLIDHLLAERAIFNLEWDKLIKNLCTGKKFMLDLIEQATKAYDEREQWCNKLKLLRVRAIEDLDIHVKRMGELQRKNQSNQKLTDFLAIKGQRRVMKVLQDKEIIKRKKRLHEMEEKSKKYSDIIHNVMSFMKETDIQDIMTDYKKKEDENFALFNMINELNREMEELNDELEFLRLDIDEQSYLKEDYARVQLENLHSLRAMFDEVSEKTEEMDFHLRLAKENLSELQKSIFDLFRLCRCSWSTFSHLLGQMSDVTQFNVLLFLQELEKDIHNYICMIYNTELETKKLKKHHRLIRTEPMIKSLCTIDEIVPSNPCPLCVEHEMVSEVIDVVQRAHTREETDMKLMERLQLPDGLERVHNLSACHLPKARQNIQKRYQ